MQHGINILTETVQSAAQLAPYRAVGADGGYAPAAGHVFGFTEVGADSAGQDMPVVTLGTAVVQVGGAVALDDELEIDVDGKLVTKTAGVTVARARRAATAADQKIEIFILPN